jgi:hypothetical protein
MCPTKIGVPRLVSGRRSLYRSGSGLLRRWHCFKARQIASVVSTGRSFVASGAPLDAGVTETSADGT